MNIPIEDKEVKKIGNLLRIDVIVIPRKRAIVEVKIYNEPTEEMRQNDIESELILKDRIAIEGEEYDKWGEDDGYLENLILSKYGLVKKV